LPDSDSSHAVEPLHAEGLDAYVNQWRQRVAS
jgi:hypothetical protein